MRGCFLNSLRAQAASTPGEQLEYAFQVAAGMDYLHQRGVLHCDLAARNISSSYSHTVGQLGSQRRACLILAYVTLRDNLVWWWGCQQVCRGVGVGAGERHGNGAGGGHCSMHDGLAAGVDVHLKWQIVLSNGQVLTLYVPVIWRVGVLRGGGKT